MSRTKHHRDTQTPADLWSRRGWSHMKNAVGKYISKRAERARLKRELRKEAADE